MIRILQLAAPARFGGLERVVHALAAGQQVRGHDVHVASLVSPEDSDNPLHEQIRKSGVELHVIERPARAYLAERRAVRDLCRRLKPEVFHTHGVRPDVVHVGVARSLEVRTVSTMHGFFGSGTLKDRLRERLQVAALRRFDAVVAVSRALRDDLCARGVPDERLTAIPNGWFPGVPPLTRDEARRALGIPDSALVAGWVGRITRQKALEVAIAAMGHVQDTAVVLSVVGDGEERRQMEEFARAAGIVDRVIWHGARVNAQELMRAFDLYVLSSLWEGTPIALFEAMAAGVPVVATAVGGVPDVVSAAEAIIVPPEDPRALANGIRSIIADSDAAARRVAAAQRRLRDEFGLDSWLDHYDALYERLLSRR